MNLNNQKLKAKLWLILVLALLNQCQSLPDYTSPDHWYDSLSDTEQQLYQKAVYELDWKARMDSTLRSLRYSRTRTGKYTKKPPSLPYSPSKKIWNYILQGFRRLPYSFDSLAIHSQYSDSGIFTEQNYDTRKALLNHTQLTHVQGDTTVLVNHPRALNRYILHYLLYSYVDALYRDLHITTMIQYDEVVNELWDRISWPQLVRDSCFNVMRAQGIPYEEVDILKHKLEIKIYTWNFADYFKKLGCKPELGETDYYIDMRTCYMNVSHNLIKKYISRIGGKDVYQIKQELDNYQRNYYWSEYLPRVNKIIDEINQKLMAIAESGFFDIETEIINQSKFNKQLEAYCWAISGDILYKSFAQERLKALGIHRKSNREYMIWAEWYQKWVEEKRLFDFVKERKKTSIE